MNTKPKRLPDSHCVICEKSLDEVGGTRLKAQQFRGWAFSDKYTGGGNKDYPRKSYKLASPHLPAYLVVWGEMWDEKSIQRAISALNNNKTPWFCQVCGVRTCQICNQPINYPMGSDLLTDEGCSPHVPIHPFNPGCINKKCSNYKEWNFG